MKRIMKRLLITLILVYTMNNILNAQNPFFGQYQTPHGTVPFDRIKTEHYEPAILEGIKQQNAELDAIIQNPEKATFTNTIEAYEQSGRLLDKVTAVFGNMLSAETNDDLQALAQKIMPLLSEHSNNITLNEKLFARVKEVYGQKQSLQLTQEQNRLLDDIYDSFVRHGANLEGEAREQYRQLTNELSKLTLDFSENNLKETNRYQMFLTDKASIAGLPEIIVEAAAETAKSEGKEGWAFTLHAPSYVPFMTYAYADTANIRAGAVTVTSESQLRQALQAGSSLIVVSGSITVAEDAAGTPLMIPGNVTITGADSSSELIIRGAVQLTGDHVTIQNVKLHFISTNALQSVVHREIFLAGHSLVLDSVDTYVKGGAGSGLGGFGGTEEELLPTVYAGGFKNTVVGQNASLTVTNAVENTKIQAVYMSHDSGSDGKTAYTGSAEVYADAKTVIREGIHTENNSCADITLKGMGESIIASAKIKDFYGNENTSLTLQKC